MKYLFTLAALCLITSFKEPDQTPKIDKPVAIIISDGTLEMATNRAEIDAAASIVRRNEAFNKNFK